MCRTRTALSVVKLNSISLGYFCCQVLQLSEQLILASFKKNILMKTLFLVMMSLYIGICLSLRSFKFIIISSVLYELSCNFVSLFLFFLWYLIIYLRYRMLPHTQLCDGYHGVVVEIFCKQFTAWYHYVARKTSKWMCTKFDLQFVSFVSCSHLAESIETKDIGFS